MVFVQWLLTLRCTKSHWTNVTLGSISELGLVVGNSFVYAKTKFFYKITFPSHSNKENKENVLLMSVVLPIYISEQAILVSRYSFKECNCSRNSSGEAWKAKSPDSDVGLLLPQVFCVMPLGGRPYFTLERLLRGSTVNIYLFIVISMGIWDLLSSFDACQGGYSSDIAFINSIIRNVSKFSQFEVKSIILLSAVFHWNVSDIYYNGGKLPML